MADETAISVENLSKSYLIGHEVPSRERYQTLRESMMRGVRRFAHKAVDMARSRQIVEGDEVEEFWALKDVSFEVKRGEVLGIIGRNGAGKSTLLKVLSRITEPTEGHVRIRGRVASLLEVGTGFHPELTGRENIFLNGAILGMSRAEIRRKFDEIVAFADVERFLDTPVKRFSSGMYVRLAFAVAAHLEPEILIVDEVLAVGDAEFQKKCLGKMQDVVEQGRTILFVSHQLHIIAALCKKASRLEHGRIVASGPAGDVVQQYLLDLEDSGLKKTQKLGGFLYLKELRCEKAIVHTGDCQKMVLSITVARPTTIRCIQILIYSEFGERVGVLDLRKIGVLNMPVAEGEFEISLNLRDVPLTPGRYRLGLYVHDADQMNDFFDLAVLTVAEPPNSYDFIPTAPQYRGVVEFGFSGALSGSACGRRA